MFVVVHVKLDKRVGVNVAGMHYREYTAYEWKFFFWKPWVELLYVQISKMSKMMVQDLLHRRLRMQCLHMVIVL